jgi:hypothetical protein
MISSNIVRQSTVKTTAYLLLTCLAGYIELGSLIFALRHDFPLWAFPLVACTYQVSNLIPLPIRAHPIGYLIAAGLALPFGILLSTKPWMLLPYMVFASASVQGCRSIMKPPSGLDRFVKRCVRIVGFLLAFTFASSWIVVGITFVCIMAVVIQRSAGQLSVPAVRFQWIKPDRLCILMLVHQMHYFCYYSLIPFVFWRIFDLDSYFVSAAFVVGWASYIAADMLWSVPSKLVFLNGHILAAVCIALLATGGNMWWALFWWFMSGFGGGTVFVIRSVGKTPRMEDALDQWETFGHIVGPFICLLVLSLSHSWSVPFYTSAALAIASAVLGMLSLPERGGGNGIGGNGKILNSE